MAVQKTGKTKQHAGHTSNYTFVAQGQVVAVIGVARSCSVVICSPVHDTASEEACPPVRFDVPLCRL